MTDQELVGSAEPQKPAPPQPKAQNLTTPEVTEPTPEVNDNDPDDELASAGVGRAAKDLLVNGLAGGVEQAVRGTYETVRAGVKAVGGDLPQLGKPAFDEPEALPAAILRDVTQFGLGFVGGMGILRGVGVAQKMAPVVKEIVASGLGTGIVADPTQPRLANLVEKYPALQNPITDYLEAEEGDSVAEGKFKAALEDMMLTPVAMVLFKSIKALRHLKGGNEGEAAKLSDEIVQDAKLANGEQVDIDLPDTVVTPETAAKSVDQKAAEEYSRLGRITDGGDLYTKLSDGEKANLEKQIAEHPEASYKLTASTDGTVRAYRNAFEVKDAAGKPLFALTEDELSQFSKHVDYQIKLGNTEDIFNFPAFQLFNARKSGAQYETQQVLDAMWTLVKPKVDSFMDATRRHSETERLADLMGNNPEALIGNIKMIAKHADDMDKYLVAGKALLYNMAREARSLATRVNFGTASDDELKALADLKGHMADLMGAVTGLRKGAARTTSAGNIKTGQKFNEQAMSDLAASASNDDLKMFAKRLALAETPEQTIKAARMMTTMEKVIASHNEVWINGILSGPKTHVVNMVSAAMNSFLRPVNQIVGGTILRDAAEVREGMAVYRGMRSALFDSFDMARRAFRTEDAVLDPGKSTDEVIGKSITPLTWELKPDSMLGQAVDYLGLAVRLPTRFLKAEDEFFKQINYRAKIMAHAAREGTALVQQGKLQEVDLDRFIKEKFDGAFNASGAGTDTIGLNYARQATFTNDLNAIKTYDWFGNPGARIQQFANGHPWLRGSILPFIKVPTNLFRTFGDFTPPIAALKKEGMDILTGKDVDPARKAEFVGRLSTGAMMWTAAITLAYEGRITGAEYGDKDMRARQVETGWQPYSLKVNVGGKDQYISFSRNDPYGMFFGIAADVAYLNSHIDENSKHSLATALTLAVAKNISSKSYLQGLSEQLGLLGGGYTAEEHVDRYFRNRAASYVPAYFSAFSGNDELKEMRSVVDAVKAKVPGMTSDVEAKRDYFGEKRMAPMGYPWNAINPYPVSEGKADPVREELSRLSRSQAEARFAMPNTKLGSIDLTTIKNEKGQSAYDRWTELIGKVEMHGGLTFHERLKDIMDSPRYTDGTDGIGPYGGNRVIMIRNEAEKYHAKALREMLSEFDDQSGKLGFNLRDMVKQDKRNANAVQHGRPDAVEDILQLGASQGK